jgi:hypothetical protein
MKTGKESMKELLSKVKFLTVKIESAHKSTVHLCTEETFPLVEKKAKDALKKGDAVTWTDGRQQWIEDEPIGSGSTGFDYVWHKDGNRVKCQRRLYTRAKDGTVTHEVLRLVFRDYLKLGD